MTFNRGTNSFLNIFMRPYASLVFPMFRPFSACSHWSCIQCSLSCLADLLTFLHRPLYCCVYSRKRFLSSFSLRFLSASFSVSSEIHGFLVVLFAGTVASTVILIACSIFWHVLPDYMLALYLSFVLLEQRCMIALFSHLSVGSHQLCSISVVCCAVS
jgi:hypothetical protein